MTRGIGTKRLQVSSPIMGAKFTVSVIAHADGFSVWEPKMNSSIEARMGPRT
jgi:alpha-L-fucosidase